MCFNGIAFNGLAGFVMRSMLAATLMFAAATGAQAQMTTSQVPGTKPKTVQTVPIQPPAMQTPSATADAMAKAERLALQSDLAWVGQYNGAITGDVSERMVAAIKEYQKAKGGKPTGVLNPQERAALAETARKKQDSVGWKIVTEPTSGARLGIPSKLVPQQASDANGSKWTSPTGTVQVLLSRRKEANPTATKLAELEKEPSGRKVDYTVVKPDFFVLSGLQGLKKFYVRGSFKGDEVRTMTILYDQATENIVEPVVIAMSSAFNAFPSGPQAGPPPRKTVEYGTGIVISDDGAIVADRLLTDGCLAITIAGHGNADRLAEDKEHDLALLRIYGARGLKPLSLAAGAAAKTNVDVVGIADPQSQGGATGVSSLKAALAPVSRGNSALSPPPAVGFSGAAAIDGDGKFAGIALLKPALVAGPATSVPASQAVMVSADAVRDFLKANNVAANGTSTDAKAAVVRVICVRK
ncbi:peptidoglycan-binding protein [Bradyrhizobium sp. WBOS7]|uniref:Peptidoglycan-binding protein n=2 Tax=Nitrobacteraceae TaxID=41294 RepID=A0AAE9NI56_9BRAD|nr:peptidoglycan-binding protein [Bradyrhizobium sp. WBOS2]MDD1572489.1 peptidoglycan-binding protein [Bradyrhizobium sp. WBOS1]MDD1577322.1 peptidoglycan-binding protein [Bradyrhizobium sp. WBOS7]MDD1600369.1 peptidoglycan-binding protein [Bradyrhizobium sp. WBOS16]UUO38857.1 peptidoglycan-binding protein [Bradyrhizobium sp. WBOS01]UUO45033.1 peptidoglycan-binding protein [Bradyrhizobium sp. WBOS02]UUO57256.1 peptidoglycan-binding protein [Bradyrhizobium sp. WBOS07]UUO69474.1 peptidoglycan-